MLLPRVIYNLSYLTRVDCKRLPVPFTGSHIEDLIMLQHIVSICFNNPDIGILVSIALFISNGILDSFIKKLVSK